MGNDQSAEECPLCDEDLSLEEVAHRTGRMLAEAARQTERLEAAEAVGAAALALARRYAAAEAAACHREAEAVAAYEASRAEANRSRQGAAGAHEATTRRLTEVTRRLVQETEERHEAVRAENNGLRSENEKLTRELESVVATPDYWHAFRQHWMLYGAKSLGATTPALADAEQHHAAEAASAAAFEAKSAEADELRSENERLKLELDQERERAAAARAAAAERSSVGDEGVEESKSETQAPSTRVSFDAAEKISVVGSKPVEGETGSRASSPKRKMSSWLCGGARAVTPPPSPMLEETSHTRSPPKRDGALQGSSRGSRTSARSSHEERPSSFRAIHDEDWLPICGISSFNSSGSWGSQTSSISVSWEPSVWGPRLGGGPQYEVCGI